MLAAHGILERFTSFGIPLNQVLSDAIYHGGTRSGSFYGSTPLGGLLVLTICGAVGLILSTDSRKKQFFLGACTAACLATIVFTNTRASWIALFLGLVVGILDGAQEHGHDHGGRGVRPALQSGSGAAGGHAHGQNRVHQGRAVAPRTGRLLHRGVVRLPGLSASRIGMGRLLYDVGRVANGRFIPRPKFREIDPSFSSERATVHSAYLQLLVKTGLLGLAGFGLFVYQWLRNMWRTCRLRDRDEREFNLAIGVSAGLLGYLVHSGLENFFQWPVMAQSFWLFMGLSAVMLHGLLANDGHIAPVQDAPEEAEA